MRARPGGGSSGVRARRPGFFRRSSGAGKKATALRVLSPPNRPGRSRGLVAGRRVPSKQDSLSSSTPTGGRGVGETDADRRRRNTSSPAAGARGQEAAGTRTTGGSRAAATTASRRPTEATAARRRRAATAVAAAAGGGGGTATPTRTTPTRTGAAASRPAPGTSAGSAPGCPPGLVRRRGTTEAGKNEEFEEA